MKRKIIIANLIRYAAQMCVFIVLLNLIYNSSESSAVKTALYIISAISLILTLVAGDITNSATPTIDDIISGTHVVNVKLSDKESNKLREALEKWVEESDDEPQSEE